MTMDHPRLSPSDVQEFVDTVVRNGADELAVKRFLDLKQIDESKHGNPALSAAARALVEDCQDLRDKNLEPVEAKHCGAVFTAIEDHFGDEELGDPQFWSYLAVRYFWQFISYRQQRAWLRARGQKTEAAESESESAKLERYVVGKDHYQIPLRMYLRAQAVREGQSFDLTVIEGGGTDFWRSQILGVRTSMYPPVARTVARLQDTARLNIEEQRPPGRRVNRLRANVDFVLHDDDDANDVLSDLWVVTDEDRRGLVVKKAAQKAKRAERRDSGSPTPKAAAKKAPSKSAAVTTKGTTDDPTDGTEKKPTKKAPPRKTTPSRRSATKTD